MKERHWYIVLGLVIFAFIFQVFLRYQYIVASGVIYRIDRLTAKQCSMPCIHYKNNPFNANPYSDLIPKASPTADAGFTVVPPNK